MPNAIDEAYRQSGGALPRSQQAVIISAGPDVRYADVSAVWARVKASGWTRVYRTDPADYGQDD